MDVSEITRLPPPPPAEAPTMALVPAPEAAGAGESQAAQPYQQCDECGAPVDPDQRYCVACGAHRRHVNDPAARYLSQASARSRSSRAAGSQRTPRSGGRSRGLGTALVLALIPLVAAVGVMAGRSSNNNDAKLIQELAKRQAAVVTSASATPTTASATADAGAPAGAKAARHTKKSKTSAKTTSSTKNAGKVISTTQYGSVTQIAGSKPTQAQEQQGAAATQQVQKSTGKSYVNGQSNLPGTVVVP
jgi:hypothetical protein